MVALGEGLFLMSAVPLQGLDVFAGVWVGARRTGKPGWGECPFGKAGIRIWQLRLRTDTQITRRKGKPGWGWGSFGQARIRDWQLRVCTDTQIKLVHVMPRVSLALSLPHPPAPLSLHLVVSRSRSRSHARALSPRIYIFLSRSLSFSSTHLPFRPLFLSVSLQ